MRIAWFLSAMLFATFSAAADDTHTPPSIDIVVAGAATRALGITDLADLPRHRIETTDHGTPAVFEGFALIDVLRRAGVEIGEKMYGPALVTVVLVEAADGYRAAFALPELDPAIRSDGVFLVDRRDGKALSAAEGPWRLVAPGEHRAARWVRQVKTVNLRRL